MTAMKFALMNTPSSGPSRRLRETPTKQKVPASSFFDDLSLSRQWSEIESTIASAHAAADNDAEIGWIEGRVHETRSTQKEVEILLLHPPRPRDASDAGRSAPEALRIFITCSELSLFIFAINQDIKVSLKGARVIHELVPPASGTLPFSLLFSSTLVVQSVHGGVCMPDGVVIDARQDRERCTCLESAVSNLSLGDGSPSKYSSESMRMIENTLDELDDSTSTLAPLENESTHFDEYHSSTPALSSLAESMMTPLLGIIESAKPVSLTATGELCVGLTIADASSYSLRRGFRVTLFSPKSRLARELPSPTQGNVVLLKAVKINKWPGGIIGSVYANNLDWIIYDSKTDSLTLPKHSKNEPVDPFYQDLEKRKELFRSFIRTTEVSNNSRNGREA